MTLEEYLKYKKENKKTLEDSITLEDSMTFEDKEYMEYLKNKSKIK